MGCECFGAYVCVGVWYDVAAKAKFALAAESVPRVTYHYTAYLSLFMELLVGVYVCTFSVALRAKVIVSYHAI